MERLSTAKADFADSSRSSYNFFSIHAEQLLEVTDQHKTCCSLVIKLQVVRKARDVCETCKRIRNFTTDWLTNFCLTTQPFRSDCVVAARSDELTSTGQVSLDSNEKFFSI